jgi:hypothetical protein
MLGVDFVACWAVALAFSSYRSTGPAPISIALGTVFEVLSHQACYRLEFSAPIVAPASEVPRHIVTQIVLSVAAVDRAGRANPISLHFVHQFAVNSGLSCPAGVYGRRMSVA